MDSKKRTSQEQPPVSKFSVTSENGKAVHWKQHSRYGQCTDTLTYTIAVQITYCNIKLLSRIGDAEAEWKMGVCHCAADLHVR